MQEWKVQVRKSSIISAASFLHWNTHTHTLIFSYFYLCGYFQRYNTKKPHVKTVLGKCNQPLWPHFQQCPHFVSRTSILMLDMQQIQQHSHTGRGGKTGKRNTQQSETVSELFGKPAAAVEHSNTHEHPLQVYLLSRRKPFTTEYAFLKKDTVTLDNTDFSLMVM